MNSGGPADSCHDFDFLHGSWVVAHRRRLRVLRGDDTWSEFGGTMACRPILGGWGNRDDNAIAHPDGRFEALTLRMFDPDAKIWRIYWIDGRRRRPDPSVVGGFKGGVGLFEGDDEVDGVPVRVRFAWTRPAVDRARWQQSFSADGGVSWECNWIMAFAREPTGKAVMPD